MVALAISADRTNVPADAGELAPASNNTSSWSQTQIALHKHFQYPTFRFVDLIGEPSSSLFQMQKTVTLLKGTSLIEVGMNDEGRVEVVSEAPVFLYTDSLGACIAAVGRCGISKLIGIVHLPPEGRYDDHVLFQQIVPIMKSPSLLGKLDKRKIVRDRQYESEKLRDLIVRFLSHPAYEGEPIELFFAGGNGDPYDEFWRELTIEYAKTIPQVKVMGSYFNPYHASPEIQCAANDKKLSVGLLAGITNTGSILLHKSHDIDSLETCLLDDFVRNQ